ncbi:hypothetical protein NQZ68_023328 [Dissostichus eleginoides]|nr:hypothetical protein NQZ68_023328 [Dissostichus eleginoides]
MLGTVCSALYARHCITASTQAVAHTSCLQRYTVTVSVQRTSKLSHHNEWDEMSYSSSTTCSTTNTSCRSSNNPTSITTPSSTSSSSSSSLYSSSLPPNSHATYHQYCCPARLRLPKPPCALPPAKHHEQAREEEDDDIAHQFCCPASECSSPSSSHDPAVPEPEADGCSTRTNNMLRGRTKHHHDSIQTSAGSAGGLCLSRVCCHSMSSPHHTKLFGAKD